MTPTNDKIFEQIAAYLAGEMSAEEHQRFSQKIRTSQALQASVKAAKIIWHNQAHSLAKGWIKVENRL